MILFITSEKISFYLPNSLRANTFDGLLSIIGASRGEEQETPAYQRRKGDLGCRSSLQTAENTGRWLPRVIRKEMLRLATKRGTQGTEKNPKSNPTLAIELTVRVISSY